MAALDAVTLRELVDTSAHQVEGLGLLLRMIDERGRSGWVDETKRFMLTAIHQQHRALDVLLAIVLEANPDFRPSQSGLPWDAVQQGFGVMKRVTSEPWDS